MFTKALKIASLLILGTLTLTACDPPMPPEVEAALAEQSYTCVAGVTQVSGPAEILAVAGDWQSSVTTNCPGMEINPATKATPEVELQIGDTVSAPATSYATVPFAVDGVVLAVSLTNVTNVNLNADAIEKIWNGTITTWNDPALVALNPSFELPATPITVGSDLDATALKPLNDWLTRLAGHPVTIAGGKAKLATIGEGQIVATSYAKATAAAAPLVSIVTGKVGTDGVTPQADSIASGATMFKSKTTAGVVSLTFDPTAKPIAPEGVNVAPTPYQAVSVVKLNLVGTDSLKTRAAARYILRQDSQGSLALSSLVALPEVLRIISLTDVSKGLPKPVITPPAK